MFMPSIFHSNNLFDDFFDFPFFDERPGHEVERKLYGPHAQHLMKTDIKEEDAGYQLEMDLPGFKKEEITVQLENGSLIVTASKGVDNDQKDDETGKYIRRERYAGTCQRSFYVGDEVEQEDIKAEFKDGILKLFVPKKEAKPAVEEKKFISIEG